jgi:AAA domain
MHPKKTPGANWRRSASDNEQFKSQGNIMPDGIVQTKPVRSRLKAVEPKAAEPSKPKILIFGKPGVGKTWASLDFPSVYYIDTEGGADLAHYTDKLVASGGVYLGPDQGSLSFDTVIDQIKALATERHSYKTVVIDSITKLFNVAIADEAERLSTARLKNEFGADKKPAVGAMRRLVAWLTRLDMNAVLIAHENPEWGMVNGSREQIGSTFDCWPKLSYELHLALNITKQGPSRLARIGKSRLLGFEEGTTFPWSYADFADRYGREVIESEVTQIVLATLEQLAEVERLVALVKLPEGQVEKWLTAAGVAEWAEMDTDRVNKAIAHLKGLIA